MSGPDLGSGPRPLRPGEIVQIKSAPEILATLDADGKLDGLPFMPEMLAYCGQTVTVYKRADRTCDTIFFDGQRRMHDAVFLTGLRCDGSAHGGCQAGCLIFWKESWLRRPSDERIVADASGPSGDEFDAASLFAATRQVVDGDPTAERFMCQATEISQASAPLPWWEPSQYVREVATGNANPLELIIALVKWVFVQVQRKLTGSTVPLVRGKLAKTPKSLLDLRPGELVRVKTKKEIAQTLDRGNRNRGLTFDSEMLRYCGGEYRVLRRVNLIINEKTGELMDLPGDCIVLDNVTCTADYHRLCRRSIYPYWRELWLTRVPETSEIIGSPEPRRARPATLVSVHLRDLAMPELEREQLPDLFGTIGHAAPVFVDHAANR